MKDLIKKVGNPEIFLEMPLIIVALGVFTFAMQYMEDNPRTGLILVGVAIVIIILEKAVERIDSKG